PLAALQPGDDQTARVRVRHVSGVERSQVKRMVLVRATLQDDTGTAAAVWFNQAFMAHRLHVGDDIVVHGKVKHNRAGLLEFQSPAFEVAQDKQRHVGALAPVYHETQKLSSRKLRNFIEPLLETLAPRLNDVLPPEVMDAEGLLTMPEALRAVH